MSAIATLTILGNPTLTIPTTGTLLTSANVNVAYGVAGLDSSGNLVGPLIVLSGTSTFLATLVGNAGQESLATDTGKVTMSDGATGYGSLGGWAGLGGTFAMFGNSIECYGLSGPAGNPRGTGAVDLQLGRTTSVQVAVGAYSLICGSRNTAFGTASVAIGWANQAIGDYAFAAGYTDRAIGRSSVAFGESNYSSGSYSSTSGTLCAAGYVPVAFTVSGTTVTISGNVTSQFADGDSVRFYSLSGGTANTLFVSEQTISSVTYSGGNTTFTIGSALSDRTGGECVDVTIGSCASAMGNSGVAIKQGQVVTAGGPISTAATPSGPRPTYLHPHPTPPQRNSP